MAKGSPVTTVDTAKSGNLVNWKAGALYHLTENGNVYINYAVSQQPPGGNNFALAQSGSGNSANRTDFKPQKANTSEIGTKWQVLDKACCSPPRCSVLISKMKLSKMMTGLTRNTVRNASKAMRYPWQGISLPRGR
ncbi:TonB-dependent receptor domain-containing protein [Shigella flexneri]